VPPPLIKAIVGQVINWYKDIIMIILLRKVAYYIL
jgi:hypothetical protein